MDVYTRNHEAVRIELARDEAPFVGDALLACAKTSFELFEDTMERLDMPTTWREWFDKHRRNHTRAVWSESKVSRKQIKACTGTIHQLSKGELVITDNAQLVLTSIMAGMAQLAAQGEIDLAEGLATIHYHAADAG